MQKPQTPLPDFSCHFIRKIRSAVGPWFADASCTRPVHSAFPEASSRPAAWFKLKLELKSKTWLKEAPGAFWVTVRKVFRSRRKSRNIRSFSFCVFRSLGPNSSTFVNNAKRTWAFAEISIFIGPPPSPANIKFFSDQYKYFLSSHLRARHMANLTQRHTSKDVFSRSASLLKSKLASQFADKLARLIVIRRARCDGLRSHKCSLRYFYGTQVTFVLPNNTSSKQTNKLADKVNWFLCWCTKSLGFSRFRRKLKSFNHKRRFSLIFLKIKTETLCSCLRVILRHLFFLRATFWRKNESDLSDDFRRVLWRRNILSLFKLSHSNLESDTKSGGNKVSTLTDKSLPD